MKPSPEKQDITSIAVETIDPAKRAEIRERCFKLLAEDPSQPLVQLMLARLFYLDGMLAFARRELSELCSLYPTPSLLRLVEALGVDSLGGDSVPKVADTSETEAGDRSPSRPEDLSSGETSSETTVSNNSVNGSGVNEVTVAEVDLDEEFLAALADFKE